MISAGLLTQCKIYFWSPAGRRGMVLLAIFLVSALAVIYAAHATRARYASLQSEQHVSDNLDSEYEKLLLEHSVFGRVTTGWINWQEKPCKCARLIRRTS